jgi:hypothetical protein
MKTATASTEPERSLRSILRGLSGLSPARSRSTEPERSLRTLGVLSRVLSVDVHSAEARLQCPSRLSLKSYKSHDGRWHLDRAPAEIWVLRGRLAEPCPNKALQPDAAPIRPSAELRAALGRLAESRAQIESVPSTLKQTCCSQGQFQGEHGDWCVANLR